MFYLIIIMSVSCFMVVKSNQLFLSNCFNPATVYEWPGTGHFIASHSNYSQDLNQDNNFSDFIFCLRLLSCCITFRFNIHPLIFYTYSPVGVMGGWSPSSVASKLKVGYSLDRLSAHQRATPYITT